jgi:hypothetical protein
MLEAGRKTGLKPHLDPVKINCPGGVDREIALT